MVVFGPKKSLTGQGNRRHRFVSEAQAWTEFCSSATWARWWSCSLDSVFQDQASAPEGQSRFYATLLHWRELNLSFDFTRLASKCAGQAHTLEQVVFNRASLHAALEACAQTIEPLSREPILHLWLALLQDVQVPEPAEVEGLVRLILNSLAVEATDVKKAGAVVLARLLAFLREASQAGACLDQVIGWLLADLAGLVVPTRAILAQVLGYTLRRSRHRDRVWRVLVSALTGGLQTAFLARVAVCASTNGTRLNLNTWAATLLALQTFTDLAQTDLLTGLGTALLESVERAQVPAGMGPVLALACHWQLDLVGLLEAWQAAPPETRRVDASLLSTLAEAMPHIYDPIPAEALTTVLTFLCQLQGVDAHGATLAGARTVLRAALDRTPSVPLQFRTLAAMSSQGALFSTLIWPQLFEMWSSADLEFELECELLGVLSDNLGEPFRQEHVPLAFGDQFLAQFGAYCHQSPPKRDEEALKNGLRGFKLLKVSEYATLLDIWKSIQAIFLSNSESKATIFSLFCQNLASLICPNDLMENLAPKVIARFGSDSVEMLQAISSLCPLDTKDLLKEHLPQNLEKCLIANLSESNADVRRYSARILAAAWPSNLFSLLTTLSDQTVSLLNVRNFDMKYQKIQALPLSSAKEVETKIRFFIGNLWVPFTLLWKSVSKVLVEEFSDSNQEVHWSTLSAIIVHQLEAFENEKDVEGQRSISIFLTELFTAVSEFEGLSRQSTQGFIGKLFDSAKDCDHFKSPKLVSSVMKLLAGISDFKQDTKFFEQVRKLVFVYLASSNIGIQEQSLNFCCKHFKGMGPKQEALAKLIQAKQWKRAFLDTLTGNDLETVGSRGHQVFMRLLMGVMRKTAGLKPGRRGLDRRLIIEQFHQLESKAHLEAFIGEVFEEFLSPMRMAGPKAAANLEMALEISILALPFEEALRLDLSLKCCQLLVNLGQKLMSKSKKSSMDSKLRTKLLKLLSDLLAHATKLTPNKIIEESQLLKSIIFPVLDTEVLEASGKRQLSNHYNKFLTSIIKNESNFLEILWAVKDGNCMLDYINRVISSMALCKIRRQQIMGSMCTMVEKYSELELQISSESLTQTFKIMSRILVEYLGGKPSKNESEIALRLDALTWILENGFVEDALVGEMLKNLALFAKKRELSDSEFSAWFGIFGNTIKNVSEDVIPAEAFDLLIKFNTLDRRIKFVPALAKAIGIKITREDVNSCFPIRKLSLKNRNQFLFALKQNAAYIYSEDFSNAVQANSNLQEMVKSLKDAQEFTREYESIIMKEIVNGFNLDKDSVFTSFVALLRYVVIQDPSPGLKDFQGLTSPDPDEDFFENLRHLQLHRRNKCLISLLAKLKAETIVFSEDNIGKIILPIFYRYVLKDTYKKYTDLVSTCMDAVTFLASRLSFRAYIRKVDALLAFETEDKQLSAQRFNLMARFFGSFTYSEENLETKDCERMKSFVGKVSSRMKAEETERILHLYVALAKIFVLFPKTMGNNSQSLIIDLSNKLKSKDFKYRNALRHTLGLVLKELGKTYFHFFISVLESSLQRGNQVHIMMYTVHHVINKNLSILDADTIVCLQDKIISLVLKQLTMDTMRDKASYAKASNKCPEVASVSAYSLLTTLASYCDRGSFGRILSSFIGKPLNVTATTALTHWHGVQQKALNHIYIGLTKNEDFAPNDFVILANGIFSGRLLNQLRPKLDLTTVSSNLKEFALDLLLLALAGKGEVQDGLFVSTLKLVTDELVAKNMALIPRIFKLLVRLHSIPSLHTEIMANHNLNLELFTFINKNFAQFHAMKSEVVFKLSCQVLERVLEAENVKFPAGSKMALKTFVIDHLPDCSVSTWTVMLRLIERLCPGENETDGKKMCQMMVTAKSEGDFVKLRRFVAKTCSMNTKVKFGLQNLDYADHEGRKRVILMLGDALQERIKSGSKVISKDLEQLFFTVTNKYINENSKDLQGAFGKILSLVVDIDVRQGENISLKYVSQCLEREDDISRLFSIIVASTSLSRVEHPSCLDLSLKIIQMHWELIQSCPTKSKGDAYLQLKLLESILNLMNREAPPKGLEKTLVEDLVSLSNLILHPNKGIRETFLRILDELLREEKWTKSSPLDKGLQLKLANNLLEVLKVSPYQELVGLIIQASSFKACKTFIMKKILSLFRDEKINDAKTFTRRMYILEVAKILAERADPFFEGDLIKLCQESEPTEELQELSGQLVDILKRTNPEVENKIREPLMAKAQLKRKSGPKSGGKVKKIRRHH